MAFILNPYEANLDLTDKDDRKLFADASKGLKDDNLFDGKRENFAKFSKLIEKEFNDVRVMKCLSVPTEWDVGAGTAAGRRIPRAADKVDFFSSYQGDKSQIEMYCDLVWATSAHGASTPMYFDIFDTAPANTAELNALRQQRQLRHIIMGSKIWKSLDSETQIEYAGQSNDFKRRQEYDGPLLWDFIRRRVNPSTTVGASKFKEELETKKLLEFDNDVVKFNTWFMDVRTMIIRDEGPDKYNEYLRNVFRSYLTCTDKEFIEVVKGEKRRWMQGQLPQDYDYTSLLDLGRITFNNLKAGDEWEGSESKRAKTGPAPTEEKQFLALATELIEAMKGQKPSSSSHSSSEKTEDGGIKLRNGRELKVWRFQNPSNEQTKTLKDGTIMRWCLNNCHPKPMWCGRQNCLNREDYAAKFGKKGKQGDNNVKQNETRKLAPVSEDFKIALAAMTSNQDFETLKNQFFSGN